MQTATRGGKFRPFFKLVCNLKPSKTLSNPSTCGNIEKLEPSVEEVVRFSHKFTRRREIETFFFKLVAVLASDCVLHDPFACRNVRKRRSVGNEFYGERVHISLNYFFIFINYINNIFLDRYTMKWKYLLTFV